VVDPILYQDDMFVLLEPGKPEQFLTAVELQVALKAVLSVRQGDLPADLQRFESLDEQVQNLIDTTCELELSPGRFLQWYAVRLEK